MRTSLLSGRTLTRHREVVEEDPSITNKKLKKQLEITSPQVDFDVGVGIGEKKKKLELNDFPAEILIDILSRLPIPSILGAAKYTCKLWKLLVSDPMFIELYATENPGCLYALRGDSNLYFAVNSSDDKPVVMKLPGDMGNEHKYKNIDSCHGLLCYGDIDEKYIYVCNPIIGDVVKIPIRHGVGVTGLWRGLGYAPLSKKYKLFQLYCERQPNKNPSRFAAAVFTLGGDDSWRDVDSTLLLANVRFISENKYCNGSLYWKTTVPPNESNSNAHVISFDLETETFRLRRVLPVGTNYTSPHYKRYLTVLGETVAYVICSHRGLQKIWMLVDELKDIWVEKFYVICSHKGLQKVWMLVDELKDIWVEKYCFYVPTPGIDDVHFTLSGIWLNKEMYGMEYTTTRKTGPGPGRVDEITEKNFLSFKADSKTYKALQLPFPKDINADGISPKLVISHVGSFISPSKIVAAGRRQPSLVAG